MLNPDRYFDPAPGVRDLARELYGRAARLPLVCPHGHVDPRILAENTPFPDPAALLVIPDHYVTRMLYSQGVPLEALGVPSLDGTPVETDSRRIWRLFAEHMPLFRGTPSGCWLRHELADVFGIDEPLTAAQRRRRLRPHRRAAATPTRSGRAPCSSGSSIEVLCTTDSATDTLAWHQQIRALGLERRQVRPTFRPDLAINILHPDWRAEMDRLGGADRARASAIYARPTSPPSRRGAPSSAHGRHRHRPRGADALHDAAVRRRRRRRSSPARRAGEATPADLTPSPGTC